MINSVKHSETTEVVCLICVKSYDKKCPIHSLRAYCYNCLKLRALDSYGNCPKNRYHKLGTRVNTDDRGSNVGIQRHHPSAYFNRYSLYMRYGPIYSKKRIAYHFRNLYQRIRERIRSLSGSP